MLLNCDINEEIYYIGVSLFLVLEMLLKWIWSLSWTSQLFSWSFQSAEWWDEGSFGVNNRIQGKSMLKNKSASDYEIGMYFYMRYTINIHTFQFQIANHVQFTTQQNRVKAITHGVKDAIIWSRESICPALNTTLRVVLKLSLYICPKDQTKEVLSLLKLQVLLVGLISLNRL